MSHDIACNMLDGQHAVNSMLGRDLWQTAGNSIGKPVIVPMSKPKHLPDDQDTKEPLEKARQSTLCQSCEVQSRCLAPWSLTRQRDREAAPSCEASPRKVELP